MLDERSIAGIALNSLLIHFPYNQQNVENVHASLN